MRRDEARLGERAPGPGETRVVPRRRERNQRHTRHPGLDEPAVAEIDAGVVDLGGLRARPVLPEEEDVCGLERGAAYPLTTRHLAAHRIRRSSAQRSGEAFASGVAAELEDAPDEPGAVEAAGDICAERRLGLLA